jgi:hypothetical protein
MATTPQTTSYHRDRVGEGRLLFCVPGGSAHRLDLTFDQPVSHQGDEREQSKKDRRCPRNRQVIPLPLSFDSSDNVAKLLLEFSAQIPRERLRPAPVDHSRKLR